MKWIENQYQYVIEIPTNCILKINEHSFKSSSVKSQIPYNDDIPNVNNFHFYENKTAYTPLRINHIKLDDFHDIKSNLQLNLTELKSLDAKTINTNINVFTIILYVVLTMLIIYIVTKYFIKRKRQIIINEPIELKNCKDQNSGHRPGILF